MSIYDYMTHFWSESEREAMSLNEASLYFYLLYEANRQRWTMPFKCSTAMIRLRLRTSTQNIMNAREGLMEKGLISFKKGIGKEKPAFYTLLLDTTYGSKKKAENLNHKLTDGLTVCNNDIIINIDNKEKEDTALTPIDESRYGKLNAFLRLECPHIAQMEMQMTEEQFYMALDMFKGDAEKMATALRKMENLPIYYDDTATLSFERILSSIRFLHRKKNLRVAFIDYLQILQNNDRRKKQTEEQFFGMVTRMLKNLAKELDICIILLSQISRSADCSVEPSLSRIRGSGQIVEAADVVILIYRPEVYDKDYSGKYENYKTHGTALIKIAKGRNIGTSEFLCRFDVARTHFSPISNIIDYQREMNKGVIGKSPF